MKRVLRIQPKPTREEDVLLNNHFILPGWQFDSLIGNKCTEISKQIVYWKGAEPQFVVIYGLKAVKTDSGKSCIANFFVHYGSRVFQFGSVGAAAKIPDLLRKEHDWTEYTYNLWKQKVAEKTERKTKLKKLEPAF